MRLCRRPKLGRPFSSKATISPSRIARCELSARLSALQLRIGGADVVAVAALEADPPGLGVGDRAHAVPLDLVGPAPVVGRQILCSSWRASAEVRSGIGWRSGSSGGSMRWIIQSLPGGSPLRLLERKQPVAAAQALAVERDLDLVVVELVGLVRAAVPDAHLARRRTRPWGCRPRTRGTRAGGPRCGRRAGSPCGSSGMPLGIAHEAATPSCSRRRSQCSRVAWCSWTTKRVAVAGRAVAAPSPPARACAAGRACGGTRPGGRPSWRAHAQCDHHAHAC